MSASVAEAVATVFWIGHMGTFRVALAVAVTAPALWYAQRLDARARAAVFVALAALAFWASAAWSAATGLSDDGRIVADEVVGAALVLFVLRPAMPLVAGALLVVYVVVDRLKPWPVNRAEDLPGAAGVVLDDIAAAVLVIAAALAGRALLRRRR